MDRLDAMGNEEGRHTRERGRRERERHRLPQLHRPYISRIPEDQRNIKATIY